MTKRAIGREIIEGLEEIKAWRKGETKLRTTVVELTDAARLPTIRQDLGLSQQQFARFMGVSVSTLRNWEQGRRMPRGPARSLLLIAAMEPAAVLKAFMAIGRSTLSNEALVGIEDVRDGRVTAARQVLAKYKGPRKR